jgi:hypothetical protein
MKMVASPLQITGMSDLVQHELHAAVPESMLAYKIEY